MARNDGWVPQQHGAWAMLVVPLVVGMVLRARLDALPAWAWPLAVTWLVGYFCFNACSLWLRAAPRRRPGLLRPLAAYGLVAALAGSATLALGGTPLLWWLPCYAVLLGIPLWLAARRHERDLLGGLCTVLAACLLAWMLPFTTPQALWAAGASATSWAAVALFGYFFGTVFVVKTLIRQRGKRGWVLASIGWHACCTLLAALAAARDVASVAWVAFFLVGSLRAWALPWFGPRRGRTIRPAQVGALEVVLSLVALLLCLA